MDVVQDWVAYLVRSGYVSPSYLYSVASMGYKLRSYISPIIDRITQKPDLASILLVIVVLFLSLKILNMLYQAVMFWVRLALRVLFWGTAVILALWIVNRGADGAMDDIAHWTHVWKGEYDYWKDQAESSKLLRNGPGRNAGRAWR